ncbi:MAG: M48 family metallopeptidase [Planctomycetota bacterium]
MYSAPARLLDAVRARPHPGRVEIGGESLLFHPEQGVPGAFRLDRITGVHQVAGALHVEIAGADGEPSQTLIVDDAGFEARLEAARNLDDFSSTGAARRALRRLSLRTWCLIAVVALPLTYWAYSAALPLAHVWISREAEVALGDALHETFIRRWTVIEDEGFRELVDRMVTELRDPEVGYDVRVSLVDDGTPNAFAAPGGRIVVFSGLLDQCPSADALAGVLAHEIAHVERRHGLKHLLRAFGLIYFATSMVGGGVEGFAGAESVAELSSGLLILKYSRDHEREADRIAVAKLRAAGRDARGLVEFFDFIAGMEEKVMIDHVPWLSTHPLGKERRAALRALMPPPGRPHPPWLEPTDWASLRARIARRAKKH